MLATTIFTTTICILKETSPTIYCYNPVIDLTLLLFYLRIQVFLIQGAGLFGEGGAGRRVTMYHCGGITILRPTIVIHSLILTQQPVKSRRLLILKTRLTSS